VLEAGFKCVQGKGDRELDQPRRRARQTFLEQARLVRRYWRGRQS
jgi:hypothetical protein